MALDLEPDRTFQEKWWRFERVGWVFMLTVVLAALAGLTGRGGPVASARVMVGDTTVTYPRVARWQTASEFSAVFPAGGSEVGQIMIPDRFLTLFSIESVTPQPDSVTSTPEGILYEFRLEPGSGERRAQFSLRPVKPSVWTTVRAENPAAPAEMSFIVLP